MKRRVFYLLWSAQGDDTAMNDSGSTAIAQDMKELEAYLFGRWGLPEDSLGHRPIAWRPSGSRQAVWGPRGGVVSCEDARTGLALANVLQSSADPLSPDIERRSAELFADLGMDASLMVDHSLLWRGSCRPVAGTRAESVAFIARDSAAIGTELPAEVEHVLAIQRDSTVACWVSNIPILYAGDHSVHSVEVATMPAYRRQGLARCAVSAMLNHLASENATVLWVCKSLNVPSLNLALALGFVYHFSALHWSSR